MLAYYIANINIEETYHRLVNSERNEYEQFSGIALADTFNLYKNNNNNSLLFETLNENSNWAIEINKKEIKVIIGNPPYALGDKKGGLEIDKVKYPNLDERIRETYSKLATNSNKKSLKDSYIRSFRWATDKIGEEGIVCFVTNGSWLDSISGEGLRKSLVKEYDYIYCLNLRGNQRTQGELSKREGGKVFGSGSRTPVSIVMLVKLKENLNKLGKIYYKDIGDYLTREEKLHLINQYISFEGVDALEEIVQDENGDWINKRNDDYQKYIQIYNDNDEDSYFKRQFRGNATGKDNWVYSFSKDDLRKKSKYL